MVRASMAGYIDLHCHWVAGVDDGVKTASESAALLAGLRSIGFTTVVATPHMRPGMFDNTSEVLRAAFDRTCEALDRSAMKGAPELPELLLSSEHFFDDIVFQRLMSGEALPYPGGHAALVEFPNGHFPAMITSRFFDLRRRHIRPVLAHPERYEPVWRDPAVLEPLLDGGAVLLLDVAALAGKYGRTPRRSAERLLELGYYYAACSDAHSPRDLAAVDEGIGLLRRLVGDEEAKFLLEEGPRAILEGSVEA
jgi:protein-tyrosine phosphatase